MGENDTCEFSLEHLITGARPEHSMPFPCHLAMFKISQHGLRADPPCSASENIRLFYFKSLQFGGCLLLQCNPAYPDIEMSFSNNPV